jgi:hypothetical protein
VEIPPEAFGHYTPVQDLWVITVYYNPCRFQSRRSTYDAFVRTMRTSKVNILTIECAFGDEPFELSCEHGDVLQLRSASLLWQKERLLNIAASLLPQSCKYVAWVDCDVLFMNFDWTVDCCSLLASECAVVQLWETCVRLDKGNDFPDVPDRVTSFAAVTNRDITTLGCGRYDQHGHTGYAWAMRRELFDKLGLYEHAISGSADHFMAHAVYGQYGFCIENALKHDVRQIEHLLRWSDAFHKLAGGVLGTVPGEILHLWHGSLDRRDYFNRMWKITDYGFNPDTDLVALPGQPLEWRPSVLLEKPELVAYFAEYFASRREDD